MPTSPYRTALESFLDAMPAGTTISESELLQHSALPDKPQAQTKRKYLRELIRDRPQLLDKVTGFYPDSHEIIRRAEGEMGQPVSGANLVKANEVCRNIVAALTRPIFEEFIRDALAPYTVDGKVELELSALTSLLLQDFVGFIGDQGRSLVSRAGTINHELLMRALETEGMQRDSDFQKTGSEGKGDIIVEGKPQKLNVEVKSYHARERLVRALKDVPEPKVGAGFFKNANEFSAARASAILGANAAALYMPSETLQKVEEGARQKTAHSAVAENSPLYRPLEAFPADMAYFKKHGKLPPYEPE